MACAGELCLTVQLWPEAGYKFELLGPICNSASVLLPSVWFPFSFLVNIPFEKFQPCFIELGGKVILHCLFQDREGN